MDDARQAELPHSAVRSHRRQFTAIYNACISNTPEQLAASIPAPFAPGTTNPTVACAVRGVPASPINPLGQSGVTSPLASVNVDDNPFNDRLPYDSRFIPKDKDTSYATGLSLYNRPIEWFVTLGAQF